MTPPFRHAEFISASYPNQKEILKQVQDDDLFRHSGKPCACGAHPESYINYTIPDEARMTMYGKHRHLYDSGVAPGAPLPTGRQARMTGKKETSQHDGKEFIMKL